MVKKKLAVCKRGNFWPEISVLTQMGLKWNASVASFSPTARPAQLRRGSRPSHRWLRGPGGPQYSSSTQSGSLTREGGDTSRITVGAGFGPKQHSGWPARKRGPMARLIVGGGAQLAGLKRCAVYLRLGGGAVQNPAKRPIWRGGRILKISCS